MRTKFEIRYPNDYHDENLRGKRYKPGNKKMVVMNSDGIFFVFGTDGYYSHICKLSEVLPKYDVVWRNQDVN